jgi:hypothetical protein
MGVMTQAAALLKAEVQDAVIAEVGRVGPGGFSKDAIVKRFADRSAGRTTLYRWVDACLASGEPGQRLAKQVTAYARTEGGEVRNAKLLVTASEHLRRSIETASRLYDSIVAVQRIDQFNNELLTAIEAVHEEFPEAAELIIRRTRALADRWLLDEKAAGRKHARTR